MKLAAGLLLVAVIAGQGVDGKRQLRGERGRHLITLKQAMGVGKKFQERWNNGYLYDDDADDLGFTWDDYINSPSTGPIRVRQRDEDDDLGLTLKQAMGVGKKFQERWNNGYLYDDDDDRRRLKKKKKKKKKGYPPLCRFDGRAGWTTVHNARGNLPCGGRYCC
jgi:hypothetical protein